MGICSEKEWHEKDCIIDGSATAKIESSVNVFLKTPAQKVLLATCDGEKIFRMQSGFQTVSHCLFDGVHALFCPTRFWPCQMFVSFEVEWTRCTLIGWSVCCSSVPELHSRLGVQDFVSLPPRNNIARLDQ